MAKRQKTTGDCPLGNLNFVKNCFPDDLLQNVVSYLPKTSVALFATLFISDTNDKQLSATSKTIVSAIEQDDWKLIDFRDVDEELRIKLNDDDIQGLLLVIDAKNKLTTLELPLTMTGRGLTPLRGSVVLEELLFVDDLVDSYSVRFAISMKEVLSIIESILSKGYPNVRNSLKRFDLLEEHLHTEDSKVMFRNFTNKHHRKLARCGSCTVVSCIGSSAIGSAGQGQSCEKCRKHFCKECVESSGYDGVEEPCDLCGRHLCKECSFGDASLKDVGPCMACNDCTNNGYDY